MRLYCATVTASNFQVLILQWLTRFDFKDPLSAFRLAPLAVLVFQMKGVALNRCITHEPNPKPVLHIYTRTRIHIVSISTLILSVLRLQTVLASGDGVV